MNEIIVAIDHSPASLRRARQAAKTAAACQRPLHIVAVLGDPIVGCVAIGTDTFFVDTEAAAREQLAAAVTELSAVVPVTSAVAHGSKFWAVRAEARRLAQKKTASVLSRVIHDVDGIC